MANLYGVANAPGLPIQLGSSYFTGPACNAGVYTTVGTTPPLIAPSQGYFYALVLVNAIIACGAALPTNIFAAAAIGAGSYAGGIGMATTFLTASASNQWNFVVMTPVSQTAWQGAGSVVNIGVQPLTNGFTWNQFSSGLVVLLRAPDQ